MALPALVTLTEFDTWCQRPVTDLARAGAILSAASTLVRTTSGRMWVDAAGDIEDDLTETQLDAARNVVKQVAERVYFNPNGNTQEGSGPFSRSVSAWYSAGMALSDEERAMIGTAPQTGIPGLWSARVVAPAQARATTHSAEWWEDDDDNQVVENDG